MGNTQYGRPHTLRYDDAERQSLAIAVMTDLEATSQGRAHDEWPPERRQAHQRRLRSLLERLSD